MAANTAFHKFRIAACVIVALSVVAAIGTFFMMKQHESRPAPETLLTFTGIPEDTTIKATLKMAGRTVELSNDGEKLLLTPEERENFKLPYTLQTTLQFSNGEYRDLSWRIDSRGAEYYILADGFTPRDKITLLLDDQKVYTIPFDWSGRIELPIILIVAKKTKACINIVETAGTFAFCHYITEKKAA